MRLPAKAHVAIADGTRFVLMHNTGTADAITLSAASNPDVADSNKSAGTRHQDGGMNGGKEDLAEFAHAAGVAEYLNKAVLSGKISDLLIVADPKTLGEMRQHYHAKLKDVLVGEIDKTLTGQSGPEIAKAITAA